MQAATRRSTLRMALIVVACFAIGIICAHFANVLGLSIVPLVIWFFIGLAIGVVFHELGHLVCAAIVSIPVRIIQVGTGPIVLDRRFGDIRLELRAVPYSGFIGTYPAASFRRWRFALFYLGGVLGNVAVIGAVGGLNATGAVSKQADGMLGAIVFAQAYLMITTLVPHSCAVGGHRLASDGLLMLRLLWSRRFEQVEPSALYATLLSGYASGGNPPSVMSSAGSRVLHQIYRTDRWTNKQTRRDFRDSLLRELARGELSREEEMLVLDALVTAGLISGDPEFRPQLDEWSLRALQLGSELRPLLCTRGGVLIELGRYQEGKALLTSMVSADQLEPFDSLMVHIFLARAEYALGNTAAAQQFAIAAQTMAAADPSAPMMPALLTQFARELAVTGPPTHGPCPSWLLRRPQGAAGERA